MAPKISVIITCYNLGQYLGEAVDSVFAQTYDNWEIIIIDDGSTDPATIKLLDDFQREKTKLIRTENRGLALARNKGIELAAGDYLCALDADDKLAPDYFVKTVEILDRDPSITFVSCWHKTFGDEEWDWKKESCDLDALLLDCTVGTAALVRKAAVLEAGGYDPEMGEQGYEDWDLWITIVENGGRGVILPEFLFYYRIRQGSMSSVCTERNNHKKLYSYIVDKHRQSFEKRFDEIIAIRRQEIHGLLTGNYNLEREIETSLRPTLANKKRELEALEQRLQKPQNRSAPRPDELVTMSAPSDVESAVRTDEIAECREAYQHLMQRHEQSIQEIKALRNSLSWKLTAPLRKALDLILKLK